MLIKSKLYTLEHGVLTMDPAREFGSTPVIKLGNEFKKVAVSLFCLTFRTWLIWQNFEARFKSIPNITELDHLTVSCLLHDV